MNAQQVSLSVPLSGRRVVVVGGGPAALRRVSRLLRAGARVEVVCPHVEAALEDLADRGEITWQARLHRVEDLAGAWLVVAATGNAQDDAAVVEDADSRGVWSIGPGHGSLSGEEPHSADATDPAGTGLPGPGTVTLVGGGPSAEGLLTVAGLRAVRGADVVVVDRLAPLGVLDDLGEEVEVIDVSKIPRGRSASQDDINAVLVDRARAGRAVVRLKGGDPYVFGRGMEEALACAEAGIPVAVVPGVTSAVAAPELAGIPVTHRGLSQGFTVVSGHVPPGDPRSTLDWVALARAGTTLVVLMGVHTLPAIAQALVEGGMAAATPLASVMDAGLPSQQTVVTTVGALARDGRPEGLRAPAVTVVGEVAAFASPGGPAQAGY
jgi:uroporphyrin-III C-methyltransferase